MRKFIFIRRRTSTDHLNLSPDKQSQGQTYGAVRDVMTYHPICDHAGGGDGEEQEDVRQAGVHPQAGGRAGNVNVVLGLKEIRTYNVTWQVGKNILNRALSLALIY